MTSRNERDPAVIIAKCAMEGHTHACGQCGWTGHSWELRTVPVRSWRKPRLDANRKPPPTRQCPDCLYTDELGGFAVFDPDDIIGLD